MRMKELNWENPNSVTERSLALNLPKNLKTPHPPRRNEAQHAAVSLPLPSGAAGRLGKRPHEGARREPGARERGATVTIYIYI